MTPIEAPYLLFLGDVAISNHAKTALGLRDWAPERCRGQYRLAGCRADTGLPDMTPLEAAKAGVKTMVVGVAPMGGRLPAHWVAALLEGLEAGLHLASGMHDRLSACAELAALASAKEVLLHDVRHFDGALPTGTGAKRSGLRALTVGLDCAIGKKYAALCVARDLQARGLPATFRATGQTGILIAGAGIAVDAVVADFIAGAAEMLSPANAPDHWDIVEGQGALFHPSYAGVTLGLIHGTQPDAMILCAHATRTTLELLPDFPHVSFEQAIETYAAAARLTNPRARVTAISVNTSGLKDAAAAKDHCAAIAARTGLACTDPIRFGAQPLTDSLLAHVHSS
jgi:uncharacterized NAD-dependent epimerase/dehydratase family protein